MKKAQANKIVKKVGRQKDMSVSELSKSMLKGFGDVGSQFKVFDRKMIKGFKDVDMRHDELAGMIARGFTETQTTLRNEIQDVEERLGARIGTVEHKVDRIQDSVNELSYESRKMKTRVDNLELKVFGSIQEA